MTLKEHFAIKTMREILSAYDFPKRFLAYAGSQFAKEDLKHIRHADPRAVKAVEIAERYGNGEDFSRYELEQVCNDAHSAYCSVFTRDAAELLASYCPVYATAYTAIYAAAFDADSLPYVYFSYSAPHKPFLIELIETRMSKLEKLLIFGIT